MKADEITERESTDQEAYNKCLLSSNNIKEDSIIQTEQASQKPRDPFNRSTAVNKAKTQRIKKYASDEEEEEMIDQRYKSPQRQTSGFQTVGLPDDSHQNLQESNKSNVSLRQQSRIKNSQVNSVLPASQKTKKVTINIKKKGLESRKMFNECGSGSDESNEDEKMKYLKQKKDSAVSVKLEPDQEEPVFNPRFKNYKQIFDSMLNEMTVVTAFPIVSCTLMNNAKSVITVTKRSDQLSMVRQWNTQSGAEMFNNAIKGSFIKVKEITQDEEIDDLFAVPYNDNGVFHIRVFDLLGYRQMTVNLNDVIGIDDYTMCLDGITDPYIVCQFIGNKKIYIALYHSYYLMHYHFIYKYEEDCIDGVVEKISMSFGGEEFANSNFIYKCFYNNEYKNTDGSFGELYMFYRQGHSLIVNANNIKEYLYDDITDYELGNMHLIYNQVLMVRSEQSLNFYKIEVDELTEVRKWTLYHDIESIGFINFTKGNVRFQLITAERIQFYLMDKNTLMPTMENCMYNYMDCTQMMFDKSVQTCVFFKQNQKSFMIYRRNQSQKIMAEINNENLEGQVALELPYLNAIVITNKSSVGVYDALTYEKLFQLSVTLMQSESREPTQVLALSRSFNDNYLAVLTGKMLMTGAQVINQIYLFQKTFKESGLNYDLYKNNKVNKNPMFKEASRMFHISKVSKEDKINLIFSTKHEIFTFDVDKEEIITVIKFMKPFEDDIRIFTLDINQGRSLIASNSRCVFINMSNKKIQKNITTMLEMSDFKCIIYNDEDNQFYVIANRFQSKLGVYVVSVSAEDYSQIRFLFKLDTNLNIDAANLYINLSNGLKELIISFKTIYMNSFSIYILDLKLPGYNTIWRHESVQLWESDCYGMMVSQTNEFMKMNKSGIFLLNVCGQDKRVIKQGVLKTIILHSLESFNYLKIDEQNSLMFEEFKPNESVIRIQQEQNQKENFEDTLVTSNFINVYSLNLQALTLRELMIFTSLSRCSNLSQILGVVKDQILPFSFYKSSLDFDAANMISILSFDSKSMNYLLQDEFMETVMQDGFPLFYKNKLQKTNSLNKFFHRNAIETALRANQLGSVQQLLDFVVTYQNNYVSSFMLNKILNRLISQEGIIVKALLSSNVFKFLINHDKWPSSHFNNKVELRYYNDNLFLATTKYHQVFPEKEFNDLAELGDDVGELDTSKLYKIQYSINLLPQAGAYIHNEQALGSTQPKYVITNDEFNLLELCAASDELDMFESLSLQELIRFKYEKFAFKFHLFGCVIHFLYIIILMLYASEIYLADLDDIGDKSSNMSLVLLIFLAYPFVYECIQMIGIGVIEYVTDIGNWVDLLFIISSVAMPIVHTMISPMHWFSRALMCCNVVLGMRRTFNVLRIFAPFSPIVVMLSSVIVQLSAFMTFYFIQCLLFSLMIGVLGVGNYKLNGEFRDEFFVHPTRQMCNITNSVYDIIDEVQYDQPRSLNIDAPMYEYKNIGHFAGNFITIMRISMGDFEIMGTAEFQDQAELIVFWCVFMSCVFVNCIIFMNFIIAEAGSTYTKISENLSFIIQQQKADLIAEAESFTPKRFWKGEHYPKYIVSREVLQ